MSNLKKNDIVSSKAMIDFFLKKLFEENLIDTDTFVLAKSISKEDLRNGTKEQVHTGAD